MALDFPQDDDMPASSANSTGGAGSASGVADGVTVLLEHDPRVSAMVTNFRLLVTFLVIKTVSPIDLPLMAIGGISRGRKGSDCHYVDIQSKHVWSLRLASRSDEAIASVIAAIDRCIPRVFSNLFAFAHFENLLRQVRASGFGEGGSDKPALLSTVPLATQESLRRDGTDSGWGIFNIKKELLRMTSIDSCAEVGLGQNITPWFQVMSIAQCEGFKTYPQDLILPRRATLDVVLGAAKFRQNARVPSISWIHINTGACLARCSQPRVGAGASGGDDQLLCSYLNQSLHASAANEPRAPATATAVSAIMEAALVHQRARQIGAAAPPQSPGAAHRSVTPPPATPPSLLEPKPAAPALLPPSLVEKPRGASQVDFNRAPPPLTPITTSSPSSSPGMFTSLSNGGGQISSAGSVDATFKSPGTTGGSTGAPAMLKCEGRKLHIIDCRSKAAAAANMATGGGFEIVQYYDRAEIHFMGLGNIHEVRGNFAKVAKLVSQTHQPSIECPSQRSPSVGFMTALEETGWVRMTQKILWAAWRATNYLCDGDSVLVHCTDGWDRTAQVVSLAMLMLDSHYRTIEGFCILVEREWLQMGHRFADRCNHDRTRDDMIGDDGGEGADPDAGGSASGSGGVAAIGGGNQHQVSPCFVQFIDCVYQIMRMHPDAFEFTPQFLIFLVDQVYSCRFGTFLFNCHRSRFRRTGVISTTASLWTEIEGITERERRGQTHLTASEKFINPFFNRSRHAVQGFTARRLTPSFHSARYTFWASWYFRFRTDCIDTGLVGLEPDHLTPLIEAFMTLVPNHFRLQHQQHQRGGRQLGRRSASNGGSSAALDEEGDGLGAGRATHDDPNVDDVYGPLGGGNAGTVGGVTAKRHKHSMFTQRVVITALQSDWVIIPSASQVSSTSPAAALLMSSTSSNPGGAHGSNYAAAGSGNGGTGAPRSPLVPLPAVEALQDPQYKPRSEANQCTHCAFVFTFFSRRHTCRRCCRSVCNDCSSRSMVLQKHEIGLFDDRNATGPLRVCDECFDVLTRFNMNVA